MAAGDLRSGSVDRGIAYLLAHQRKNGSWWEKQYTGTGFPKVFYLKYHMYAEYFPLLALATYSKVMNGSERPVASLRGAEKK
jgi:squalene-hopene/tetraprenyl-beta-curcumene cyclase